MPVLEVRQYSVRKRPGGLFWRLEQVPLVDTNPA